MARFPQLELLRRRRSAKWTSYDPDVLPLPVAELDVELAPAVAAALHAAVERSDTGYAPMDGRHCRALAAFALRRWGWRVDPAAIIPASDVGSAVRHALGLARPGPVVVSPPVYPQFLDWPGMTGRRLVTVPLISAEPGVPADLATGSRRGQPGADWRLDLPGLEAAFAAGAAAYVLCHPHNPVGRVHERAELAELAALAARYGVLVISDEVHAPLTFGTSPGGFVPFLDSCPQAVHTGVAVHSPSKAWNIAGLKCAFLVAPAPGGGLRPQAHPLSIELPWEAGIFGAIAAEAAYLHSVDWLDGLIADLQEAHRQLTAELAVHLPRARVTRAGFGYLAWVDLRALGWPEEPARLALRLGRVALGDGPSFGEPGAGHVRINIGTGLPVIREAVRRLARADAAVRA